VWESDDRGKAITPSGATEDLTDLSEARNRHVPAPPQPTPPPPALQPPVQPTPQSASQPALQPMIEPVAPLLTRKEMPVVDTDVSNPTNPLTQAVRVACWNNRGQVCVPLVGTDGLRDAERAVMLVSLTWIGDTVSLFR